MKTFFREMTFFLEINFNKNEAFEGILLRIKIILNGLISVLYSTFVYSVDHLFELSLGMQEMRPELHLNSNPTITLKNWGCNWWFWNGIKFQCRIYWNWYEQTRLFSFIKLTLEFTQVEYGVETNTSDKPINITPNDRVHSKSYKFDGSLVNGIRQPVIFW